MMKTTNLNFTEIEKLHDLLFESNIPHDFRPLYDGYQIVLYADTEKIYDLDDAVINGFSHGCADGLLETYKLNGCEGWETAEEVFAGWKKLYEKKLKQGLDKKPHL